MSNSKEFEAGQLAAFLEVTKALEEVKAKTPNGSDPHVCLLVAQHMVASLANGVGK